MNLPSRLRSATFPVRGGKGLRPFLMFRYLKMITFALLRRAGETRGTPTVPLGLPAPSLPPRWLKGKHGEFSKFFEIGKFSRFATNFAYGKVSSPLRIPIELGYEGRWQDGPVPEGISKGRPQPPLGPIQGGNSESPWSPLACGANKRYQ